MLPETAFLRRLPVSVNPESRLIYESLTTASDLSSAAYARLEAAAAQLPIANASSLLRPLRSQLVGDAWSLIDNLHSAVQLLQMIDPPEKLPPAVAEWLEAAAKVGVLRNYRDHLRAQIPNLAKRKGHPSPIFGALLFQFTEIISSEPEPYIEINTFGIVTGHNPQGSAWNSPGVDLVNGVTGLKICLHAFDETIDLTSLTSGLAAIINRASVHLEKTVAAHIEASEASADEKAAASEPFKTDLTFVSTHTIRRVAKRASVDGENPA